MAIAFFFSILKYPWNLWVLCNCMFRIISLHCFCKQVPCNINSHFLTKNGGKIKLTQTMLCLPLSLQIFAYKYKLQEFCTYEYVNHIKNSQIKNIVPSRFFFKKFSQLIFFLSFHSPPFLCFVQFNVVFFKCDSNLRNKKKIRKVEV